MTRAEIIEFETITLFTFAAFAGMLLGIYIHQTPKVKTVFNLPVIAPFITPVPTAVPALPVTTVSQTSSDGEKEVIMYETAGKSGKIYSFSVKNADGTNAQQIYKTTLTGDKNLSIPFNAFSPDDTYVFIQQYSPQSTEALVFRADGQPISPDAPYDNATQIFNKKQTGNTYQTATGWASSTLLIIDSKTPNGDIQSYWFEVPSKAIIPLATQF